MGRHRPVEVTLTSDGDGDATGTSEPIIGKVKEILVVNDADDTPTNNWDLTVRVRADKGTTAVYRNILVDATVSNSGSVAYHPKETCNKVADGDALSSTYEDPNVVGPLLFVGANMGDTKKCYIIVFVED